MRTKVGGKTIPNRGIHNRESPFLSGGSATTRHHKVPLGCREERSATRAGRSQNKDLQKIRRRVTKDTMPDNRGDPVDCRRCAAELGANGVHPACIQSVIWPNLGTPPKMRAASRRTPFKGCK